MTAEVFQFKQCFRVDDFQTAREGGQCRQLRTEYLELVTVRAEVDVVVNSQVKQLTFEISNLIGSRCREFRVERQRGGTFPQNVQLPGNRVDVSRVDVLNP